MDIISFIDQPNSFLPDLAMSDTADVLSCEQPGWSLMFWCCPICSYFRFSVVFFCWSLFCLSCPISILDFLLRLSIFPIKMRFLNLVLVCPWVQASLRNICLSYRKTYNWCTEISSTSVFSRIRVARSFVFCLVFGRSLFIICPFPFGHCIVRPSSIYDFW